MSDEPELTNSGRPRRTTRVSQRLLEPQTPTTSKRKRDEDPPDPAEQLEFLLKNPKSILTRINISVSPIYLNVLLLYQNI
jgi:hypothetical protein